jgi:hypothetical protein
MYTYTRSELNRLETLDQSWDGAELKIDDGETRVWLVPRENRGYDGDYQVETLGATGKWTTKNCYFEIY